MASARAAESEVRKEARQAFLDAGAPAELLELFDFEAAIARGRRQDLGYGGATGYIDFLRGTDFGDAAMLFGRDPHRRFYLAVLYQRANSEEKRAAAFFQRYSEQPLFFVNGGQHLDDSFVCCSRLGGPSGLHDSHARLLLLASTGSAQLPSGEVLSLSPPVAERPSSPARA